ncbi:MAG TPA: hemolysin family protein [Candidatus Binatia bacterium]|nr:hemolysin family protein [Candidatus Binatia bacterium]
MVTFVVLRIAAVILLVAANAFFVAAEFALVSIRETRLEQLLAARRMGARTVQKLHQKLDEFIAAVQFGVTMASLALGWIGEAAMARLIEPLFRRLPHAHIYAHAVSITVAFLLITYMHVILGEIVPKSLALQRTETVALAVAGPIDFFMTLAAPLLAIMTTSARIVLRAFGTKQVREGGVHSSEELKLIVSASHRTGVLEAPQEQMIQRALELENIVVREVMVPRPDIFSLPGDMPLDEAFQRVAEETHSRVPVYDSQRGPEHIIGVLYARDLLRWLSYRGGTPGAGHPHAWSSELKVRHLMREVLVVPETKPLTDLLLEFKQKKRHLAVVVDEFGSTAGVVTVEDILEQLVGEIEDEYEIAEPVISPGETTMVLDGGTNIRDLESEYHITLPRDEGFETLAGFVLAKLQRIPQPGDNFEFEGRRYTVVGLDNLRVDSVKIETLQSQPPTPTAAVSS